MKKLIYSKEDVDLILTLELEEKDKEIERLKELCNKYEEEHKTVFEEWKKTINIINELENIIDIEMNKMDYAKYDSCLMLMKMKIKELKGDDKSGKS